MCTREGLWSDPIRAYFWPAVNKRPTSLWPSYFLTQPKEILFDPKGRKLKNLGFLGKIFLSQTQTKDGWPGSKFLKPEPITTMYLPLSLFHPLTARPISTKFWTGLPINSGKVLNTSLTLPTQPPDPVVHQATKPKQIIGEKTLLFKKCQTDLISLNFSWAVWNKNGLQSLDLQLNR